MKVTITLDLADALMVGQTLRSLARHRSTPIGTRLILTRVGEILAETAKAMLQRVTQPAVDAMPTGDREDLS